MRILYLEGDPCSPKYVANTLDTLGFEVDRVVERRYTGVWDRHDVYLLSDYRAALLGEDGQRQLAEAVAGGAGLVFVGGWTSFGRGGYARGPLADALPVRLQDGDDRVNVPSGMFVMPTGNHALTETLPFAPPPVVTGHNRCAPKPETNTVLEGWRVQDVLADHATLSDQTVPLLVLGAHGEGRVAALATDLAPHWSGGWTDWGERRIDVGQGEEVGHLYQAFLERLCRWGAGERLEPVRGPQGEITRGS